MLKVYCNVKSSKKISYSVTGDDVENNNIIA